MKSATRLAVSPLQLIVSLLAVLASQLLPPLTPSARAARTVSTTGRSFVRVSDMAAKEQEALKEFANTAIRKDLSENLYARMQEADASTDEPAMSSETRAVMARGAYNIISSYMAPMGVQVNEYDFLRKVGKMLNRVAELGLFPHAFTIGNIGRIQVGVGVATGAEFNFYVEKGVLRLTGYSILGGQLGLATKASEQFYFALCYGDCTGVEGEGLYVGADVSFDVGLGADAYIEFGVDFTDAVKAWFHHKKYTLKELYDTHAFYVGLGFDTGIGVGLSGNALAYSTMFDVALLNLNGKTTFNPSVMAKYDLRKVRKRQ
ncbi:MAG: hypothetical protein JST80_04450 [Bdellovibrionales bacterium]|nr:hypothetical protein [Bdellovibrionales bacterium]